MVSNKYIFKWNGINKNDLIINYILFYGIKINIFLSWYFFMKCHQQERPHHKMDFILWDQNKYFPVLITFWYCDHYYTIVNERKKRKDLKILDLMPYMHYFMCGTSYLTQKISLNCWHFVFRIVPSSKISMTTIRYIILSVFYKKQELLTLHRHMNSPPIFWWGSCCSSL